MLYLLGRGALVGGGVLFAAESIVENCATAATVACVGSRDDCLKEPNTRIYFQHVFSDKKVRLSPVAGGRLLETWKRQWLQLTLSFNTESECCTKAVLSGYSIDAFIQ